MKKTFNLYIVAWAVVLALFNIVSFLSVLGMRDGEFTTSFWIGYAAITIALIGQLICAYVSFKANSAKKMFYNISLLRTSYIGLIATFVVGLGSSLISSAKAKIFLVIEL